ncbi:MAG: hypothetical protein N4A64_00445 [Marinisporobacter sp.]|nr:hypothetical protein [Marinisporobacter sp.]
MKNFNGKSFICGLLIGTIGITTVFATAGIKSAKYEDVKVIFNGSNIPLKNSLISVVKSGESDAKLYMPANEILEDLGYDVKWNESERSIDILTKTVELPYGGHGVTGSYKNTTCNDITKNETDKKALEIMQKTGNWSYVEPLFSAMTAEGVAEVVNLYIQKTGNYKQAEAALPYMNKDDSMQPKKQLDYDILASQIIKKTGDVHRVMAYMPYMSTDKVDTIVKDYIDKTNDFNCIYNIRQYMSTEGIDDTAKSYVDRTDDYGTIAAILQFMSVDASDYVAKKYINEVKDQQYSKLFTPYLKK